MQTGKRPLFWQPAVWPLVRSADQTGADWVSENIIHFLAVTFLAPKTMLEKVALPFDPK